ncbi:hypothetical protein B0H10DRAFT_1366058 [Mycena sp. CBHHK59/15]|nr:hypothetical protein B0H10DRAFT_1366058 [Mycena sp. CBHHK59/15]
MPTPSGTCSAITSLLRSPGMLQCICSLAARSESRASPASGRTPARDAVETLHARGSGNADTGRGAGCASALGAGDVPRRWSACLRRTAGGTAALAFGGRGACAGAGAGSLRCRCDAHVVGRWAAMARTMSSTTGGWAAPATTPTWCFRRAPSGGLARGPCCSPALACTSGPAPTSTPCTSASTPPPCRRPSGRRYRGHVSCAAPHRAPRPAPRAGHEAGVRTCTLHERGCAIPCFPTSHCISHSNRGRLPGHNSDGRAILSVGDFAARRDRVVIILRNRCVLPLTLGIWALIVPISRPCNALSRRTDFIFCERNSWRCYCLQT